MAVKVLESEKKPYLRYEFKVSNHPTKKNVVRIDCVDNYWDKSDYMLSDHNTGEIYSYNDVALKTCMQMINACRIDTYNVVNGMHLKAYFTEPLGRLVKVEGAQLTEESHGPMSQSEDVVAYRSIAHSLKRKASKLNDLTEQVKDGLFTDLAEDCQKASDLLKAGEVEEAQKLMNGMKADAKTILHTATELETVGEGLIALIERINR